jgi:hypothetical protein
MNIREAKFKLDWKDIKALERYHRSYGLGRFMFLVKVVGLPCIFVGVPLWVAYEQRDPSALLRMLPYLLMPVAFVVGLWWLSRRAAIQKIEKTGVLDSEISIALRDEGLWHKDATGEATTFWASVSKIVEQGEHIFVVVVSSESVVIIPKASFVDAETCRAFCQEALRLWRQRG